LFPGLKEHRGEDLKETMEIINETIAPISVHELKKWKLACPNGEMDLIFPI